MSELTDLQNQNDELRAYLSKIQNAYDNEYNLDIFIAIESTPAQSLSEVKAEAVREFWDTVMGAIDNNYLDQWGELTLSDFDDIVNDHANKLNN